jgi:hypothetical protein
MSRETGQPVHETTSHAHLPIDDLRQAVGRIKAKAAFPPSSIWFQGHFPAVRILPGVALMALAVEPLLLSWQTKGRPLKIRGFSKVRIKMLSFPGDELLISIEDMPPIQEAELGFEVSCRGEKVCQGYVLIAEQ